MTGIPWFHACTSCKANMPLNDKQLLCVRCLGVQHATETMGGEDFCDLCTAFQPRKALTEPLAGDPLHSGSCAKTLQLLPLPQTRRVKHSRQVRDTIYLKEQMVHVLELLSRQQAPVARVEVPAPQPPAPALSPGFTMGAQAKLEPQPLMAEEDTLSLAASWDEDSFPTEMEEEEKPVLSTVAEPSSEIALETSLPPLPSSILALIGRAANFLQIPWATPAEPRRSVFRTQTVAPTAQPFPPFPDFMEEAFIKD
ncbi:UNVERIFIED_CONTAM: hypothetical protein FKN15_058006 [Acipenser sinensis]